MRNERKWKEDIRLTRKFGLKEFWFVLFLVLDQNLSTCERLISSIKHCMRQCVRNCVSVLCGHSHILSIFLSNNPNLYFNSQLRCRLWQVVLLCTTENHASLIFAYSIESLSCFNVTHISGICLEFIMLSVKPISPVNRYFVSWVKWAHNIHNMKFTYAFWYTWHGFLFLFPHRVHGIQTIVQVISKITFNSYNHIK
jgi:hypothetical protein